MTAADNLTTWVQQLTAAEEQHSRMFTGIQGQLGG
jgi:hypothetical protein